MGRRLVWTEGLPAFSEGYGIKEEQASRAKKGAAKLRKKLGVLIMVLGVTLLMAGCGKDVENKDKDTAKESKSEPVSLEIEEKEEGTEDEVSGEKEDAQPETAQESEMLQNNGKLIVIDPGHSSVVAQGTEPLGPGSSEYKAADSGGTSGVSTGIPEYELTLIISQKLKAELELRGYEVILTRETNDIPLSCTQRAEVANSNNADAFVRIHANGSEDSSAIGAMTICTTPSNPYVTQLYDQSRRLSDCIINHLCTATGCENDGVWETDTMSGNNWSKVPVTIVEMGYMSNPQEDQLLADEEYQKKIVLGIAEGIDEYIG